METQMTTLDIDLEEFDKQTLIILINYCHEHNITFNQGIVNILTSYVNENTYSVLDKVHGDEV